MKVDFLCRTWQRVFLHAESAQVSGGVSSRTGVPEISRGLCGLFMISVLAGASSARGQIRTWTDSTGKFSTEAELLEIRDNQVVLKKPGNRTISVPVTTLSKVDQEFVAVRLLEIEEEKFLASSDFKIDYRLNEALKLLGAWKRYSLRTPPERNPGLKLAEVQGWVPWTATMSSYLGWRSKGLLDGTLQKAVHTAVESQKKFSNRPSRPRPLNWDLWIFVQDKTTVEAIETVLGKKRLSVYQEGYLRTQPGDGPVASEKGPGTWSTPVEWHSYGRYAFGAMEKRIVILRVSLDVEPQ